MSRIIDYEVKNVLNEDYIKTEIGNENGKNIQKVCRFSSKQADPNNIYNVRNGIIKNWCSEIKNDQRTLKHIIINKNTSDANSLDEPFLINHFNKNLYNRKEFFNSIKDEYDEEDNLTEKIKPNQCNSLNDDYRFHENFFTKTYNGNNNQIDIKDSFVNQAFNEELNYCFEGEMDSNLIYKDKSNKNNKINKNENSDYNLKKIGKWSEEEDQILTELVSKFGGKNWKKISHFIPGRSSIQCLHRWTKILQPGLVKGPWTIEEDRKLLEWVRKEGPNKWTQCADFIKGRNGKQCRERWFHTLNPKIIKGNWTPEEDFKIFTIYHLLGGKWAKIALYMKGRTENSIKNRFYSTLRRKAAEKIKNNLSNKSNKADNYSNNEYSKSKSNFNRSVHSPSSLEEDSSSSKSRINIQISVASLSLEELLKYLPSAKFEVMLRLMRAKNLTPDGIKEYENEIIDELQQNTKPNTNFNSNLEYDLKSNEEKLIKNIKEDQNPKQYINLNFNISSTSNNNILLPNLNQEYKEEFRSKTKKDPYIYREKKIAFEDDHSDIVFNYLNNVLPEDSEKKEIKNTVTDFRNLDIFSLENNIMDMCDNPSFLYSESNFNFLEHQVDNIIDSMFIQNNIQITNESNEDCNLCFNGMNPINKLENNKKDSTFEINKDPNTSNFNENKENQQNDILNNCKGEKNNMLKSLITQLEDLEKLVKSTKNELMKYTNSSHDSLEKELINKENLNALNTKIENLFK